MGEVEKGKWKKSEKEKKMQTNKVLMEDYTTLHMVRTHVAEDRMKIEEKVGRKIKLLLIK